MDFAEQVKSSVDIVKAIGEYVRLKKAGAGPRYTGLCPFHSEKTPSFSVHGGHQFYYCFGCNAKGDVFNFIMAIEGLEFFDALKLLAERNGIPLPPRGAPATRDSELRSALAEMHQAAAALFAENLRSPQGEEARRYLLGRHVAESEWDEFGLGLSEPGGQQLVRKLEKRGYPEEFVEQSGLLRRRPEGGFYDYFRGRLMFPIHSESGAVIGFGGRALRPDDQPKYLNSPETPIYRKSAVLYNLHRARNAIRKQDRAVLVEGYMDVIGVWAAGVHEVVASCGTALTNQQVRSIHRHSERVVVNFDPDAAGANATERSLQMLLDENMRVRVLALEGGLDPDEFVRQSGSEAYRARLDRAATYFHWLFDRARARFDLHSVEGRLEGWKFVLPVLQRIPDRLERVAVATDAADYLGIDRVYVLDKFRRPGSAPHAPARPAPASVPSLERLLLSALVASPEARAEGLPRLRDIPAVQLFTTKPVFDALFALDAQEGEFRFAALEARLDDAARALLAAVCLADEVSGGEVAYAQAMECIRELEQANSKMQLSALKNRIKEMTRNGDLDGALRITGELNRLQRSLGAPPANEPGSSVVN